MAKDHLAPSEIFGHVEDATFFHVPRAFVPKDWEGHIPIPQPFQLNAPLFSVDTGDPLIDSNILAPDLSITKFMILEVLTAVIIAVCFIALARHLRGGNHPRGRLWNTLEVMLLFLRDQVARPCIGKHDADRFMPFLWTIFFFVLGCNLFGMIPWMGSPTAALATTSMLALITFGVVVGGGMAKLGFAGFWKGQVPSMDLPLGLAIVLVPMIFLIEVIGLLIKHAVLAVRLLANMMAGHVVLAVVVGFIGASYGFAAWWGVMPLSVVGATALSLLELFVAFLQAYIFTFLSALFIGMAVHPH